MADARPVACQNCAEHVTWASILGCVLFRLVYLLMARSVRLAGSPRPRRCFQERGNLVLRPEVAVLRRQVARPNQTGLTGRDRRFDKAAAQAAAATPDRDTGTACLAPAHRQKGGPSGYRGVPADPRGRFASSSRGWPGRTRGGRTGASQGELLGLGYRSVRERSTGFWPEPGSRPRHAERHRRRVARYRCTGPPSGPRMPLAGQRPGKPLDLQGLLQHGVSRQPGRMFRPVAGGVYEVCPVVRAALGVWWWTR